MKQFNDVRTKTIRSKGRLFKASKIFKVFKASKEFRSRDIFKLLLFEEVSILVVWLPLPSSNIYVIQHLRYYATFKLLLFEEVSILVVWLPLPSSNIKNGHIARRSASLLHLGH